MFVKDKYDALMQMRNLGINHFPEIICSVDDEVLRLASVWTVGAV